MHPRFPPGGWVTSGPGGDAEGDVALREEQQDGGGHGAEGEAIRPAVTEAADGVQRPGGGEVKKHKGAPLVTTTLGTDSEWVK